MEKDPRHFGWPYMPGAIPLGREGTERKTVLDFAFVLKDLGPVLNKPIESFFGGA